MLMGTPPNSPPSGSTKRGRIGLIRVASAIKGLFKGKRNSFSESESVIDQFDVVNPSVPLQATPLGKTQSKDHDKRAIPSPRRRPATQPNTPCSAHAGLKRAKSNASLGERLVGPKHYIKPADKKKRREAFVLEGQTPNGLPMAGLSNRENLVNLHHLSSTVIRYKPAAVPHQQAQAESSRTGTFRVKRIPPPPVTPELELRSYDSDSTLTLVDDPFLVPVPRSHRRAEHVSTTNSLPMVPRVASHHRPYGRI